MKPNSFKIKVVSQQYYNINRDKNTLHLECPGARGEGLEVDLRYRIGQMWLDSQRPPIITPTELMFAKPHRAYVTMVSEWTWGTENNLGLSL